MKKSKALYITIISVAVILGVVALILLLPQSKDPKPDNPDVVTTSLYLDISETINIFKGAKVKLHEDAIVVVPKEKRSELNFEIIPKSTGVEGGIVFDGNIISAMQTGEYAIKLSIQKTELSTITKTINVSVHDEVGLAHTTQLANKMTIDNSNNITNMFSNLADKTFQVTTDDKIKFEDGILTALEVGSSKIEITFAEGNLIYSYEFNVDVGTEPDAYILLTDVENNTINVDFDSTKTKFIIYQVFDINGLSANQAVEVESDNESVATANSDIAQLIKISIKSRGEAVLTITSLFDPSIKITLKVIAN